MVISQAWELAQDGYVTFIGEALGSVTGMSMEKKSGQTQCKWRLFWRQRFLWGQWEPEVVISLEEKDE